MRKKGKFDKDGQLVHRFVRDLREISCDSSDIPKTQPYTVFASMSESAKYFSVLDLFMFSFLFFTLGKKTRFLSEFTHGGFQFLW